MAPRLRSSIWAHDLAQQVDRESRKLQGEGDRVKARLETTARLPGTNIAFPVVLKLNTPTKRDSPQANKGQISRKRDVQEFKKPFFQKKKLGLWGKIRKFARPITYPARQALVWLILEIYLILTFGAGKETGFYRQLRFRYLPTANGWDLMGVRDIVKQNLRGLLDGETALDIKEMSKIRKRLQWNEERGRYEVVTYNLFHDPNPGVDRYPGETEGVDPEEFEKYQYMTEEQIIVHWLGEKVVTPMMVCFELAVRAWWIFFWFTVVLAVVGSITVWVVDWLDILMILDEDGFRALFWHMVYKFFHTDEPGWTRNIIWYTQKYSMAKQFLNGIL